MGRTSGSDLWESPKKWRREGSVGLTCGSEVKSGNRTGTGTGSDLWE